MVTYHVIRKQKDNDGPVYLNETISRYIDVSFAQETIDWNKPFGQRYKQTRIPAKQCT